MGDTHRGHWLRPYPLNLLTPPFPSGEHSQSWLCREGEGQCDSPGIVLFGDTFREPLWDFSSWLFPGWPEQGRAPVVEAHGDVW